MSRIWKLPIVLPAWVSVTLENNLVTVKWPKWLLHMTMFDACAISLQDQTLFVSLVDHEQKHMRWLARTLVANMVQGVRAWFEKKLHVLGIWYGAKVQWSTLTLNLWLSHQVHHVLPQGIVATVEKDPKWNDIVTITGIDKQLVGEQTAKIRAYRKPEPYKGKWVRYFGEQIKLKAGKTSGKK